MSAAPVKGFPRVFSVEADLPKKTGSMGDRPDDDTVVLVAGADDRFAMPLTVALRSALRTLHPSRAVHVFVLDGGMSPSSLDRCRRCLSRVRPSARVEIVRPDPSAISDLPTNAHLSAATYLRLLIPDIVPPAYRRALYLDSDTLVTEDVGQLWELRLEPNAVWAVPDIKAGDHLQRVRGSFPAYVGSTDDSYFNAGVLLIDLAAYRRDRVSERALEILRDHGDKCARMDQDALNLALQGRWGRLPARWNNQILNGRFAFDQAVHCANGEGIFHCLWPKPWDWRQWSPKQGRFAAELRASHFYTPVRSLLWQWEHHRHRVRRRLRL